MNGVEKRRVQIWLLLVLAATLLVSCAISLRFEVLQETIDVTPVRIIAAGEHAYTFEFEATRLSHRLFGRQGDSNETPQRSRLRLLENDVAIGRPHSAHEEIRVAGGGRFSHWQSAPIARSPDALIFSTSDNSDPRGNGRSYRVSYPLEFGALGLTVVALLWLASIAGFLRVVWPNVTRAVTTISNTLLTLMGRAAHTHLWTVIVAGVSLYVVWFFSFAMPSVPLLFNDSYTYLSGYPPIVPLGYLAFAQLVSFAGTGLAILPAVQISIWVTSVLALYFVLNRVLRFRMVAALGAIALLLLSTVTKHSMLALTEILYASTLIFHICAVILSLERPSWIRLGLVAVTTLVTIFLRPAGFFIPVCILLLFVFRFEQRRLILLRAVLPIIVGYSLITVASVSYRGAPGQTLAWLTLFPHVAHLFRAQELVAPTEAARAVEVLLEDYRRELGAKLTSEERARYSMDNFVRIYTAMQIELRKFGAVSSREVSLYFREFALSTISNHPFAYVSHVKDHVFTAWRIHFPYAANTERWLNEHFQLLEKTHNERARKLATRFYIPEFEYAQLTSGHHRTFKRDSSIIDGTLRLLVQIPLFGPVIAITSAIVLLASLLWGRRLLWLAVAGYVGAMMHGAMLLTAFATTVIPRYVDPIVPLGIVFLVIILDRLLAVSARNVAGWLGRKGNPAPLVTAP